MTTAGPGEQDTDGVEEALIGDANTGQQGAGRG